MPNAALQSFLILKTYFCVSLFSAGLYGNGQNPVGVQIIKRGFR